MYIELYHNRGWWNRGGSAVRTAMILVNICTSVAFMSRLVRRRACLYFAWRQDSCLIWFNRHIHWAWRDAAINSLWADNEALWILIKWSEVWREMTYEEYRCEVHFILNCVAMKSKRVDKNYLELRWSDQRMSNASRLSTWMSLHDRCRRCLQGEKWNEYEQNKRILMSCESFWNRINELTVTIKEFIIERTYSRNVGTWWSSSGYSRLPGFNYLKVVIQEENWYVKWCSLCAWYGTRRITLYDLLNDATVGEIGEVHSNQQVPHICNDL